MENRRGLPKDKQGRAFRHWSPRSDFDLPARRCYNSTTRRASFSPFPDRQSGDGTSVTVLFVLTFGGDAITLQSLGEDDARRAIESIAAWWREHRSAGRVVAACKLMPPYSATTVRFSDGQACVLDGPFNSEREAVGGFGVIDVRDLDEALAVARTWPCGGYIEIRPLMSPTGRVYGYRAESDGTEERA